MGLGQPDRVTDLRMESIIDEQFQGLAHLLRGQEKVEVLGVTPDSGVLMQGKGAGDNILYLVAVHQLDDFAEQSFLVRRKQRRLRRTYRQRFVFGIRHPRLDGDSGRCVAEWMHKMGLQTGSAASKTVGAKAWQKKSR